MRTLILLICLLITACTIIAIKGDKNEITDQSRDGIIIVDK